MATYNETLKDLHREIEKLQDTVDGKNLECRCLENELTEIQKPIQILSLLRTTVWEMEEEIVEFEKTKGKSDRTTRSFQRLLSLSDGLSLLDTISTSNMNLKAINRDLHTQYQLLRVENKTLKQQLKNIENAERFD